MRLAAGLCAFLLTSPAWADYSVDFLRITCVPEVRYFEVEYRALPDDAVFGGGGTSPDPLRTWREHGYFDPRDLHSECRLPESTYVVTATQSPASDRGQCGGAPSIRLSLQRNGQPWLDDVTFGADCFGGPSITGIAVRDVAAGYGNLNLHLCIAPTGGEADGCEFLSETYAHVRKVMPITQQDLADYAAARRAGPPPAEAGKPAAREWSLVIFKESRVPPCQFPGLQVPADAVVYAAGVYGGRTVDYQIDQSGHQATRMDVTVNEPTHPVLLILSGYEPTIWNVIWTRPTRILAVLATGYHRQAVAGLPRDLPVLISTADNHGRCGYGLLDQSKPDKLAPLAQKLFQRRIDAFVLGQKGRAALGTPVTPDLELVSSPDTPPTAFLDPTAPLAGPAGLRDAVKRGLLREATQQESDVWAVALGKGTPARSAAPTSNRVLFQAYVVLKPFVYPSGLYGGNMAVFYVPKGVPLPTGEPGHSVVYDFNTLQCRGPLCR
jgi:hypothetical protein